MKKLKNLFGIMTITTMALASQAQAQSFLTNGLTTYYPFNGNANDASGNGNNAQLGTGMSFISDRFGNSNSALLYSNETGNMTTTVEQPAGNVFSLCLWLNIPTNSQGGTPIVLTSVQAGTVPTMADKALSLSGDGILSFYLFPGHQVYLPAPSPVNDGKWHHAVATLSSQGMCLYLDGLLVAQNATVTTSQGFSGWWCLASGQGSLDDVRIYNVALSSNEVQQLYVYESGPQVNLIQAVTPSFSNLSLGTSYQLQISTNLSGTFTNYGSTFTATNFTMTYPQYFNVANWSQLFFRLEVVP